MQTDLWGDPGPLACQPRSSPGSHGRALCRATADLANVFSSISVGREDPKPFAFTRNGQKCTFTARPRSRVRAPAPLITWAGEPRPLDLLQASNASIPEMTSRGDVLGVARVPWSYQLWPLL